jgi:TRAP transporter TAXI family solute receptor
MLMSFIIALSVVMLTGTETHSYAQISNRLITVGTAGVNGVYYPAGGAICRLVIRGRKEHGIRCYAESTGGSIDNLSGISQGELALGIVQSDWHHAAYTGTKIFNRVGANRELRSVFSLHNEPFTVLARSGSTIKNFDDLKGKRVDIGDPLSGMNATMQKLMELKGWSKLTFKKVYESPVDQQLKALCEGKIDAMIYSVGHPNGVVQEATTLCDARLINVKDKAVDALVESNPYFSYATIPGGMYRNNPNPISTFGVTATLVTSELVSDEVIYQVVKVVFDNFDDFKTLHPVFATLDKTSMVRDGLIAPFHAGALRYYRENGLVE